MQTYLGQMHSHALTYRVYTWRWGLFPHHVDLTISGQSKIASPPSPALSLIWELHWRGWLALNSLPIFFPDVFLFLSKKRPKHQSSKLHRGIRKETDWNVFCLFKAIVYFINSILFGNMFGMFVSNHRVLTQIPKKGYQTTRLQWTFGLTTSCCEQDRFLRPWKKDGVCSSSQENVADISAKYIKIIYGKMMIWSDC